MTIPLSIMNKAFLTMGCADWFVWRIMGEPTRSELGNPTEVAPSVDVRFLANLVVDEVDDEYRVSRRTSRTSPGTITLHVDPKVPRENTSRVFLAGDEVYRYANSQWMLSDAIYLHPEAVNIQAIATYSNTVYMLIDTDYTYNTATGLVTIDIVLPNDTVIDISYYYDKYYIEEINNYGRVYVELMLNKVSKT